MDLIEYIETHTTRLEASRRGGGIEIDAGEYLEAPGAFISAYQNYLGGGLLGSIQNSFNRVALAADEAKRIELGEALKHYFYGMTNQAAADYDEWADIGFEATQRMPTSGY